jgi:hypothetical protein
VPSREECKLRVYESKVLRRVFGPKVEEVEGGCRGLHMGGFITCMLHKILLR